MRRGFVGSQAHTTELRRMNASRVRFGRESGAPNVTGWRAQCSVAGRDRSRRMEIRLSVVIVARFEWDCAW